MPSTAKSALNEYENLFKKSKKSYGFIFKLFKYQKLSTPEYCSVCKSEIKDEKTKYSHTEDCWRLHVINTAKYDILSKILRSKVSDFNTEDGLIKSYLKILSSINKLIQSEQIQWELKHNKSLENSLVINLADFDFIKPITKGGYGQIFLIKDRFTEKLMCAKIISVSEAIQRQCLGSYVSERNLLLKCDSDQIISLFYSFRSEFFIYQIMEYMESGDLSTHLELLGNFSEETIRTVIVHILLALKELEKKSIIHGDIKLENILYSRKKKIVKLADFGLALDFEKLPFSSSSSLGTPEYMSPEQILHGRRGFESDLWAVGICTYEMFFGIPPYYDENPANIFSKIISSTEINWSNSIISDQAKNLIIKLLNHNFQSRISLKDAMNHPFFAGIDWSNPPKVLLPEHDEIFAERNKRYSSLNFYNKITVSTETVVFEEGVFNQHTDTRNQIELLKIFPIKNLNKINSW